MCLKCPTFVLTALTCAAFSTHASAETLEGVPFLVTNMFLGDSTGNVETDVSEFGLSNNLFAIAGSGIELPAFITLYDIDVSEDSVTFNWVESDFSRKVGGPMPDDKHDRNYFVFDLPADQEIKSVQLDQERSTLEVGSALPTARRISRNKIVTEFAAGVVRVTGFSPSFNIVVGRMEN